MRRIATGVAVLLVAAGLSARAAEETAPGHLQVVEGYALAAVDQQVSDAAVAMPHVAFALTSLEVTDTITEDYAIAFQLGTEAFAAAPGEEFVLARLDRAAPSYPDSGAPVVTLEAGGTEHDLTADLAPMPQERALLLVSVPEGSDVRLTVADADRSTSIDLRTGELSGDAVAATRTHVLPGATAQLAGSATTTAEVGATDPRLGTMADEEVTFRVTLDGATASRHAWIDGPGWAPEGQAYLQIAHIASTTSVGVCAPEWTLPAGSVSLTPAGGEPSQPVLADDVGGGELIEMEGQLYFHVPVDLTSAVLTLTPELSTSGGCEVSAGPEPATLEFPIELS